jgi:hypothetical protein
VNATVALVALAPVAVPIVGASGTKAGFIVQPPAIVMPEKDNAIIVY